MFRFILAAILLSITPAQAAECTPLETDIVSLGEKAARFYAQRSINAKIQDEKKRLASLGLQVGKVREPKFDCAYFPNIVAMDEWRCTAKAVVCAK
jgi:hypothetical protein